MAYEAVCSKLSAAMRGGDTSHILGTRRHEWAAALWDAAAKEVVPRREVYLYRFTDMPAPTPTEPAKQKRGKKLEEEHEEECVLDPDQHRMRFARLAAATDNVKQKEANDFETSTPYMWVLCVMITFQDVLE